METKVVKVWMDNEAIYILTNEGDVFAEHFADYQSLASASLSERRDFECDNFGIRWESLDEDFSYRGFMTENKRIRRD